MTTETVTNPVGRAPVVRDRLVAIIKKLPPTATYDDIAEKYKELHGEKVSSGTIMKARAMALPDTPAHRGPKPKNAVATTKKTATPSVQEGDFVPTGEDFNKAKKYAEDFGNLSNLIATLRFLEGLQLPSASAE